MIHPVILCGGSGTRLWPVSRKSYPKQFSPLMGEESLFQASLRRLSGPGFGAPIVLTNTEFRFIATEQLASLGISDGQVLIEPASRNTAPAVLCAALSLEATPEALMLVAPSDHVIADTDAFHAAVALGTQAAEAGRLVTFGIRPDRPETGYGYLELAHPGQSGAQPLERFVEKPCAAAAAEMLASGRFLWNAGIFLFRVCDILAAYEAHAPALIGPCRAALSEGRADLGFFRLGEAAFAACPDLSIDYAVMEKSDALSVVPFDGGWNDLGSWDAVWRELGPDADGLTTQGSVTAIDCSQSMLRSDDENMHLVGIGLKNIAAIAMRDAVLVANLDESQRVKEVVARLRTLNAPQAEGFPRCHRPWGWYETLSLAPRFQVKRIMVHPGAKLSLQSHVHRSEHWIVVSGTAKVTVDGTVTLLSENQSTYIPLGAVHRMENPGKVDMHLIEVQTGVYLGEDDIIRYEDIYART
ncbi:mannose-1-phosphate guanylyltransferase/mannose-6-phosphate isomerase (plasmid) [Paroceanicella profunda]|uniref:mannose-1-phosphate guanylyltransferase n=1 Tax=Paroceanicella profunda TaxID=2579971 RepID=A0A5B8G5D2_9RHOB|nr:mannose-1-phosphate guanylyltransferase/mannose-6-phosphate isomerase [Paroceanicella profunda]QDL94709.1 mannose-1-phosphate guanylyltransferase/mannose-6-phosphate isomerase [Paroceanicella profunda]